MACVLVVEDHDAIRDLLQRLLRSRGFETIAAANGSEGLDRMRARRPCVVVLDMNMPVMDGYEFRARQLEDPAIADVPVICVTGTSASDVVSGKLGIRCHSKPVDPEILLQDIAAACAKASPPR